MCIPVNPKLDPAREERSPVKLNMGCGHNKVPGYLNVDLSAECTPDYVCDLEVLPWIWPDHSVDAVRFNHCLEHLGQESKVFLGMMKELYRVCKNESKIEINVPHPKHDNFLGDPTHVRVITPEVLSLFDKRLNDEWKKTGAANTPLAHYLGVDFAISKFKTVLDEPYGKLFASGKITGPDMEVIVRERNNVVSEFRIELTVRK